MSVALLNQTKDDIQAAFQADNLLKIEKESLYVFDRVVHFMLSSFKDRLKGITFEANDFAFDEAYISSNKNQKNMYELLELTTQLTHPISDADFGKLKVGIEHWYYLMGGEGMCFEYQNEYLITPKEASELLGISNVTLNRYMKQGLETIDTTSHHKIPKHAIALWNDPVYAIRIQMLAQEKRSKTQTLEGRLKETLEEITELQKLYKAKSVAEACRKYNIDNVDVMDDPSDFRNWLDLEDEKKKLLEEMIGGHEFA